MGWGEIWKQTVDESTVGRMFSRHGFILRMSAFIAQEHVEELMGSGIAQRPHRIIAQTGR